MATPLDQMAAREVRQRHVFFVDWFNGRLDADAFEAAMRHFDPAFFRVDPEGACRDHAGLRRQLAAAEAKFSDFAIEVEIEHAAAVAADTALVRYVERQFRDARHTARRATALFRRDDTVEAGVAWLCVQETWIAPANE